VVDYDVIPGDPSTPDGYGELDAWLQRTWSNCNGVQMLGEAVAIDGGNWTEMVAQFVKARVQRSGQARLIRVGNGYRPQKLFVVRGRSAKSERVVYKPAKTEVNQREKTIARSVGVWGVGTDVAKHILYGWLTADGNQEAPIEHRMIRFPGGRGEVFDPIKPDPGQLARSYYEMLTAEYYDLGARKWLCPKGQRNEAWDTLVYAYWAALASFKLDMIRDHEWAALEAALEPPVDDLFSPAASAPNASRETSISAPVASVRFTVRGAIAAIIELLEKRPLHPVDARDVEEWAIASPGKTEDRELLLVMVDQMRGDPGPIAALLDSALVARARALLHETTPQPLANRGRGTRHAGVQ